MLAHPKKLRVIAHQKQKRQDRHAKCWRTAWRSGMIPEVYPHDATRTASGLSSTVLFEKEFRRKVRNKTHRLLNHYNAHRRDLLTRAA